MPESLEDFLMTQAPTAERPLLGQTLLVVEDSRFASEAIRMICQRSGARIRRADTLASAERHLRMYRPGIALIDVGLPDGSGLDLIRKLSDADPKIGVILAMSGDDSFNSEASLAAGADEFISKPITSVLEFQRTILRHLPKNARPIDIRPVGEDAVVPDRLGLRDDLALAVELLNPEPDAPTLDYLMKFLVGVARSAEDSVLGKAVKDVAAARDAGVEGLNAQVERLGKLLRERLETSGAL